MTSDDAPDAGSDPPFPLGDRRPYSLSASPRRLPDDVQRILSEAKTRNRRATERDAFQQLSNTWEAIQTAHDHTTAAVELRDENLNREFWLIAAKDLATARERSSDGLRQLVAHLSGEYQVPTRTIAEITGLSQSTVARWATGSNDPS